MSKITSQSFDERLRARILTRSTDVPVFTLAFDRNHTPSNPQVIFDRSVLCGDPGRGQTPGFPHRTEIPHFAKAAQGRRIPNKLESSKVIFEDPSLLRPVYDSEKLIFYLTREWGRDSKNELVEHESRIKTCLAGRQDYESWVEIAPSNWRPVVYVESSWGQKLAQGVKRFAILAASDCLSSIAYLLVFFGWLKSLNLTSRAHNVITQYINKLRKAITILNSIFGHWRQVEFEFAIPLPSSKQVLGTLGQGMIIASIVLFLMTGGPIIRLQIGDWWQQSRIALTGKAAEPAVKEVLSDTVRKPDEIPPVEKQFQLEIPKIGANLRVIPNVDAGDEKAYTAALKLGVAHAAGSGLPGEPNLTNRTVYIFGHSTNAAWNIEKYNALFYSLKDLVIGDDISIWFWGKEFQYKVTSVVKVDPSDLTYLAPQTIKDQLILQTCWPPGTVWKRLLVIAEPVLH